MSQATRIDHRLGIRPDSAAAAFLRADLSVIQPMWRELHDTVQHAHGDAWKDHSEGGHTVLAGRFVTPGDGQPVYWAVRDHRVHFSRPFDAMSDQDRMLLINQVLVAYSSRSPKDDLKSAALAVTRSGQFFVAMNTQELPTMDWDKECAETNLAHIIKQYAPDAQVGRFYVLGTLTNSLGGLHVDDHLIGMCMRCVEKVSGLMAADSQVTILPANDGKAGIVLHKAAHHEDVRPGEAWQIPYSELKSPSCPEFAEESMARQKAAFERMLRGDVKPEDLLAPYAGRLRNGEVLQSARRAEMNIPILEANPTAEAVNAFMAAQMAREIGRRRGNVTQAGIAVLEITEKGRKRYECGIEIKGADNAVTSPASTAVSHSRLTIARGDGDARVTAVYVMGYNADGKPYNSDSAQWDRIMKRIGGADRAHDTPVYFMPFNDGRFPAGDEKMLPLSELARTAYNGSKQHSLNGKGHCC